MVCDTISTPLAILGGGPAGYVAAIRASQLGINSVIIERDEIGGVCLNRGCIPTKALLKTSESISAIKKSREFGIESSVSRINWDSARDRKGRVVKNLRLGLEHLLQSRNVRIVRGIGTVESPNHIIVEIGKEKVDVNYEKLIITTGSTPLLLNIKGIELPGIITSTEALEFDETPESMIIIGAGAIGLEFAAMFNSAGSKITVIEMKDSILPNEDTEVSSELLKIMKRQGISFKLSSVVKEIKKCVDGLEVIFDQNEKESSVKGQYVLIAIGRKLSSASPEIKSLGLELKNGAILVDENLETNVKGVFAAGDVTGGKLLAHAAFIEGKTAAENVAGMKSRINYNAIPSCVYTNPETASVGLTEIEAASLGINPGVGKFYLRNNGRALSLGEREGFVKIVINRNTNEIIGGQILGANASEMISEITLAITLKVKADVLADMVHPHPTLSEAIWEACSDAIGRSIHKG